MAGSLKRFLDEIEPWKILISLVIGIATGVFGTAAWIRSSAQNAVLDERFLPSLAARVRPTCIFNVRGSIEADFGAGEYIDDIRVTPVTNIYGFEIQIKAKRHLAYAPLVVGIDAGLYPIKTTRGKMHDWNLVLAPNSTLGLLSLEDSMNTNTVYRFKLEILH